MLLAAARERSRAGGLAGALIALACVLAVPATAAAETYVVDSTADETDVTPGNEVCLTAGGKCTLRAAIEEADATVGEFDTIDFAEEVFEGQAADTIEPATELPAVTDPVSIFGRTCATAAGVSGPCVGIEGPAAGPALKIENANGVEVWGLAVTGAQTGLRIEGSSEFRVQASWFGVGLDGSAGVDGTGVFIGPGSDNGLIGSEGPERRDVIASSTGDGLDIHGASHTRVLGDYFGVGPDGHTPAGNNKDIEVTSAPGSDAVGDAIGVRVDPEFVGGPCDRGCNTIAGAASSGIDLQGDGGSETPAVATTVTGNYIGLDAAGTAAVPNASAGIRVGEAAQTVIGGPKAADANRINGGAIGVLAGPAAPDLVVRGNLIGVDAAGTGFLAEPDEGIVVDSGELPSPALEAAIVDNRIELAGGIGVIQQGFGARIAGNEIAGGLFGVKTTGPTEGHGNLIEGNSIREIEGYGILVENDSNEVLGNEISEALGAGVSIRGALPFGVTENLVGGDSAGDENVIVGSGGPAIEISDLEATENEVARNRGAGNAGPFIDLVAASPGTEPKGPNKGIKPPVFSTATGTGASGSGAEPGAVVRVFRKQSAEAGELQSFLGEATAGADGRWAVSYPAAIPGGTIVAATQTSAAGGTSELATATTAQSGGGGGGGSPADREPPRTRIFRGPKGRSHRRTARFAFGSDEAGSTFECRLDGRRFVSCSSPERYSRLRPGPHVFQVRATDPAGNTDPSPARRKFIVLRRR